MLRLYLLNATNVLILIRKLSQPGASFYVFACNWANPSMILIMGVIRLSDNNPRQYVMPFCFPPKLDIIGMKRGVISFKKI